MMNMSSRRVLKISEKVSKPATYTVYSCICSKKYPSQSYSSRKHFSAYHLCLLNNLTNGGKDHVLSTFPSRSLSTSVNTQLTMDSVFSDENLARVKKQITSVKSVRSASVLKIKQKPAEAAILIPLCFVEAKPSILFTMRTTSLRKHRGEVRYFVVLSVILFQKIC